MTTFTIDNENQIVAGHGRVGSLVTRALQHANKAIFQRTLQEIDKQVTDAKAAPMGPFFLSDLLGLDTVLHVAEYLQESYGDRFYVHKGMQKLVADVSNLSPALLDKVRAAYSAGKTN